MNNSNSYNVCTRCGTPNSLSAKYCYQCGGQLKVPEQPVVCEKCNTVNTGMANFCRNCGSTLKIGAVTKNCPRCGKPVAQEMSQCSCGYSFAVNKPVRAKDKASDPVDARTGKKLDMVDVSTKGKSKAGGRTLGVIGLLLTLAVIAIYSIQMFVELPLIGTYTIFMGYNSVVTLAMAVYAQLASLSLGQYLILGVIGVFVLCLVLHAICALVRIFAGCRPKKANILYLVLAVVSIAVILVVRYLSIGFLSVIALPTGTVIGKLTYAIPGYYFFFFLVSLVAKRKKAKTV